MPTLSAMASCPVAPEVNSRHSRSSLQTSFFEWVQNLQNFRWTEEEVNGKLERGERALPAGRVPPRLLPLPAFFIAACAPSHPTQHPPTHMLGQIAYASHKKQNLTLSLSPEQRATHCRSVNPS